ncbi:hypothetical protein [Pseudomonas sp. CHM02]|uniref:hypothetical protein n=1 Tax=Pseudomonas sp. CHM02 TaxID=1463662 RepID=UPI000471D941
MQYRQRGHSGLLVSEIILGTLPFDGRTDAAKRGSVDVPQARRMFDIAPEGSIGDHFADCRRMIDKTLPIWHG